ncbi:MAG: hypothetical protein U0175_37630 [Caldilineaceae bacterium]
MLGTLQVARGDHLVTETDWHTRQARQLLKILVTERPRPVSTDRLIEILWPDSTPQAAAAPYAAQLTPCATSWSQNGLIAHPPNTS